METIIVHVEKAEDGTYWGTSQNLPGVVNTHGTTIKELKKNFETAFLEHLEVLKELEDQTYSETSKFKNIDFKLDVKAFLNLVPELNLAKFADRTQTSATLLRQYKTLNQIYISLDKALKIEHAAHELGKELLSLHLH